ncbi:transposable element Tcb1 transposase [Trichonephila clavipes]|nr:transposable element Tcb1 transposase [Trichonephila clavipes]
MHHHTAPAPGIMVWGSIGYHTRTPLVRIAATAIFQEDNARPHVARIVQRFFVNHQIELLPWRARSPDLSPIENMWSMVAPRLTQITPPAATPDQLWQRVEAAWSAVPQEHVQSLFESMLRRVAAHKNCITNSEGYEDEFVKNLYETIIANGKRLEELERAEKIRLEELVKEQALKEKELPLKFDLDRFKIESGFRVNDESNDSINTCSITSNLNLKKLIPDFDPKQSDISLYLVIFERQAKRASIEKKEWVGQLLGLLPLEIVQIIAREPEEQAENYDYVKKLLLKRFKLSPEVFRQKFVQHQKKSDCTWKDFTFEITNYLDEWLIG